MSVAIEQVLKQQKMFLKTNDLTYCWCQGCSAASCALVSPSGQPNKSRIEYGLVNSNLTIWLLPFIASQVSHWVTVSLIPFAMGHAVWLVTRLEASA